MAWYWRARLRQKYSGHFRQLSDICVGQNSPNARVVLTMYIWLLLLGEDKLIYPERLWANLWCRFRRGLYYCTNGEYRVMNMPSYCGTPRSTHSVSSGNINNYQSMSRHTGVWQQSIWLSACWNLQNPDDLIICWYALPFSHGVNSSLRLDKRQKQPKSEGFNRLSIHGTLAKFNAFLVRSFDPVGWITLWNRRTHFSTPKQPRNPWRRRLLDVWAGLTA